MAKARTEKENASIACKDNQLIQLRGQIIRRDPLSATQQKIVTYSAALVKPDDEPGKRYEMTIKDFAELCGITKGGEVYQSVYREASNLKRRGLDYVENETGDIILVSFLEDVRISRKKGTISYRLPESLIPFYKQYSSQFTKINLLEYMPMRGKYALLLYELLLSWQAKGKVYYPIEGLRRLLEVPTGKYTRTDNFMMRVINPAIEEINVKSTVFNVLANSRTGKRNKVEGINFVIQRLEEPSTISTDRKQIIELLVSLGIEPPAARSLADTYSRERILGNVDYAQKREAEGRISTSLAAYVCAAISEDYADVEQPSIFVAMAETSATITDTGLAKRADPNCPYCHGTGICIVYPDDFQGQTEFATKATCFCTKR